MARGSHKSPQFKKSGKRTQSKNKDLKRLKANQLVLSLFK